MIMKVGIDPGHGGNDPGAIGPNGLKEKDVTLAVGLKLDELLKFNGFDTVITRKDDTYVELKEREKILDQAKCDIAVSIHCNGSESASANYIATFIVARGGKAETLAIFVQRYLAKATGFENGGIRVGNFHIVRETNMPAVLPEMGFITNPKQEQWLRKSENQYLLAKAIALGICDYFGMPFKEPKKEEFKAHIIDIHGNKHQVPEEDLKNIDGQTWVKMCTAAELAGAAVSYDKETNSAGFDFSKLGQKDVIKQSKLPMPQHHKRHNYWVSFYDPAQLRVAQGKPDNLVITGTFSYGKTPLGALLIEGKKVSDVVVKPGVGPRPCFCITWDDKAEVVDSVDTADKLLKYRYAFQCGPKVYPRIEDLRQYDDIMPFIPRKRGGIGVMPDGSVIVIAAFSATAARMAELAKEEGAREFMLVDGGKALNFKQGDNWIFDGDMVSSCIALR